MSDQETGVLYLIVGSSHAANLITSVASLRRHYPGPIAIACEVAGKSLECAMKIAEEPRLDYGITPMPDLRFAPDAALPWRGDGAIHASKTFLPEFSPFERTAYLDCDTLVTGDISELFPREGSDEVVLSGFQWPTNGRQIRRRLEGWQPYFPDRVAKSIAAKSPHVNTGAMGFSKLSTAFVADWQKVVAVNQWFTDDELAAQIVAEDHPVRHLDARYNRSSVYQGMAEDVRLWHFHRRMNWRDELGRSIWLPRYVEALEENLAGIRGYPIHRYNWRSLREPNAGHIARIRELGMKMWGVGSRMVELE